MLKSSHLTGVLEAGCDESGRGCLAGPVAAAAVILPTGYSNTLLNDSKKLSAAVRQKLRVEIENNALAWAVGFADNIEIDRINILRASVLAMHRALSALKTKPGHIIVDGNFFTPYENIPHTCIIKGDSLYLSIAAASVLAKTHRDEIMTGLHNEYPLYGWDRNKGYPTKSHAGALIRYGPCFMHRKSFSLRPKQLCIDFKKN